MSTSRSIHAPALALAVAAALALAACGGGGGDHGSPVAGGPATDPAPIDPFVAAVQGQVSLSAETTGDPVPIDNLVATGAEDKEPIAI
jgi:hypothetical protein